MVPKPPPLSTAQGADHALLVLEQSESPETWC